MTENTNRRSLSRRTLLSGGAGLAGAAVLGSRMLTAPVAGAAPRVAAAAAAVPHPKKTVHLVGTDGWVSMPADAPADLPFFPDSLAPSPFNTYVFGFRDVTGMSSAQVAAQRGKAQISAPMMAFDEEDDVTITLTNLGLLQRPDLLRRAHAALARFRQRDPAVRRRARALAGGAGRAVTCTYFYRPHDAGTYMYHCHFEDVEHVQMGMTGMVFVRPKQNKTPVGR